MPEATPEQISAFITRWQTSGAAERANYQMFLSELCDTIDVPRPDPTAADTSKNLYDFDRAITRTHPDGTTSINYIDLYKARHFVNETEQGPSADAPNDELAKPTELPAQVAAVRKLLPTIGQDPETLAACFGRNNKKRTDQITGIFAKLHYSPETTKRMQPHHSDCAGNRRGSHSAFAFLNLTMLIGTLSIYVISRFFIIPHSHDSLWSSYGHDCLAMVVLLSVVNLYIIALGASALVITRPVPVVALALTAGAFWEFITPLYRSSVSDPVDLVAYVAGALFYSVFVRSRSKLPFNSSVK